MQAASQRSLRSHRDWPIHRRVQSAGADIERIVRVGQIIFKERGDDSADVGAISRIVWVDLARPHAAVFEPFEAKIELTRRCRYGCKSSGLFLGIGS